MRYKIITITDHNPSEVTSIDKVTGGILLGLFVYVWLLSISSPFLFALAVLYKYYASATFIATVTFASYAKWERGAISKFCQQNCNYYSARYLKTFSIVFEGGQLPSPTKDPASAQQQTFYAIHPHGVFCIGWALLFCHDVMQHVRFCFAPALYGSPFFRFISRLAGNPGSAEKQSMIKYMKEGEDIALPPGGFEEATLSCMTQDRVFIKKRTGFIKLCLQNGMAVRPVYVFGEKSLFWNIQGCWKTRLNLNRQGLPAILTWGHPFFPLMPKNTIPIRVVVGAPLVLPKIADPTKDDVTTWHNKYIASLSRIFEEHKESAYGDNAKTMKLEIW